MKTTVLINLKRGKLIKNSALIVFSIASIALHAQKIKVACVGNSVTYGAGIKDREHNSYPIQLQQLLGDTYQVENLGHSGATLLKNGHKPYWEKPEFQKSKDFAPNIVIIHLGLNDQGNNNWPEHKEEFIADYLDMISVYKNLPSKPQVMICKMTPTFSGHHWFEEGMRESFKEIQTQIEEVAAQANVQLINLHEPLYRYPELLPDHLHPNKEGATIIAQKVYGAITGDFGGLKLPLLYGENMVFQRNQPIIISGTSNSGDEISVTFHKTNAKTIADINGAWSITFPLAEAGGPYSLSVTSKLSQKSKNLNNVYVGEVWLASGQSNMDFKVKNMHHAATVLKDSLNDNVHVFSLDPRVLKPQMFNEEELKLCNADNYLEASGWSHKKDSILENFSAVAYAFAYNLQKELKVPVGIICNAVGGSPTQSWISRERMETAHQTIDLLNDTWGNPMTDSWVAKRKFENFGTAKKTSIPARHPYDPTFLFDTGIMPIKDFNIKGVIWYQGESNAENIDLHTQLFPMLVNDWRLHWKKPEMPFYYVQLSSIKRPTWGKFRDSQRQLLSIPHTGMAISSDVGHPTDVHPKQKWIIGTRLSKIALAKAYYRDIQYSGPLLDFVNVNQEKLEVHFKYGSGLKTTNGSEVKDIQIAGADKVFSAAKAKIKDEKLIVWSSEDIAPRFVRYGYTPYTEGNLMNQYNLPTSTFSNEIDFNKEINTSARKTYSMHYYNRKTLFEAEPDTKEEIIFLGNSITEGGDWKILFPDKNVVNRGISGDVTDGILNRLNEITSSKPKKIFLMVGTNDLAKGKEIDYVLNGTRKIIEQIIETSENTTIYLQSILPINPNVGDKFSSHKNNHKKIIETNLKLQELAKIFNLKFIDLHKAMRDKNNHLKEKYTYDGLHLSEEGYVKWKRTIIKHLN